MTEWKFKYFAHVRQERVIYTEEVIYSQGELYPEEPFDRSWDSDEDSKFNEDYILPSGWI